MKKRQTRGHTAKLGFGGLRSLRKKPKHLEGSACSLYTVEQGGRIVTHLDKRWGYYIKKTKAVRSMVYSWIKEMAIR